MSTSQSDRMSSVPLMNLHERRNHGTTNSNIIEPDYDWSDQEVEEFSRDPLESVLKQMRLWPQAISRQQCVQSSLFFSALSLCVGFLLAYLLFLYLYPASTCQFLNKDENSRVNLQMTLNINAESIDAHIKDLYKPDVNVSNYIVEQMVNSGLDVVKIDTQNVWVIEPNPQKPNRVLLKAKGVSFEADYRSYPNLQFCPFSSSGEAKGQFVYANFGRFEDYQVLHESKISTSNKIVLIRLGSIPLWEINYIAKSNGAIGIVLFSESDSVDIYHSEDTLHQYYHDIPMQPISWIDAEKLLHLMKGNSEPPLEWKIDRSNIPVALESGDEGELQLFVNNQNNTHIIKNVIGVIRGEVEPDRYVFVSSERSSVGNTSLHSTAILLELSKIFGSFNRNEKWKPRRSIIFFSWDIVKNNSLGITQWMQKYSDWLSERTVGYVNVDVLRSNISSVQCWTNPSLDMFYQEAVENVKRVNANASKLLWQNDIGSWPLKHLRFPEGPQIFSSFGISGIDVHLSISKKSTDENSKYLEITTRLAKEIITHFTNSLILPFNILDFVPVFNETITRNEHKMNDKKLSESLKLSLHNFSQAASTFQMNLKKYIKNPYELRALNDQIMKVENIFLQTLTPDPCITNLK